MKSSASMSTRMVSGRIEKMRMDEGWPSLATCGLAGAELTLVVVWPPMGLSLDFKAVGLLCASLALDGLEEEEATEGGGRRR